MSQTFPLFLHATGQWAKKVRGRMVYFGKDRKEALAKWEREKEDLLAGRSPRTYSEGLSLGSLVNRFLVAKRLLVESGELSPRTWADYHAALVRLSDMLGKSRPVESITTEDLEAVRAKLAKGRGAHSLANNVQRIRTLFKYAWETGLIATPLRTGPAFRKPSARQMRATKHTSQPWTIGADDLRAILEAAGQPLRAMVLLGINCGFGNSDIASLPLSSLDLAGGWVSFPRPKTAIPRKAKLWPETVAALEEAIAARPTPKHPADAALVFLTSRGNRWVRTIDRGRMKPAVPLDSVRLEFDKILRGLGLKRKGRSFYSLRHTFRTVADAAQDQPAANAIMGHVSGEMAEVYREKIEDDRIEAVTSLVRSWLWPKPKLFREKSG